MRNDGHVIAWYGDGGAIIGRYENDQFVTPELFANVKDIAASQTHILVLKEDGSLFSAGNHWNPDRVNINEIETIAAGRYNTIVVKIDGTIVQYGEINCYIPSFYPDNESNIIKGYVSPEDITLPKSDFMVTIEGTSYFTTTDENGYFEFKNMPIKPEGYILSISKSGYLEQKLYINGQTNDKDKTILYFGDLNNDKAINMQDIVLIAKAFNSKYGDSNFVSTFDINLDNVNNMLDIISIARNFNRVAYYID